MPKRHNNIIYKQFLRSKKTIKAILSSITRIRLIIYIKDPKEAFSVDYIRIKEDIKIKKTIIADIITTGHFIKNNTITDLVLSALQLLREDI